jgi:hypothetical protein
MNELLKKFKEVLVKVSQERGPLKFAGLIERQEATYKLDIVVAAVWIDNEREFLDFFVEKMSSVLSKSEFTRFARIVIVRPDGEFLQAIDRMYGPITRDRDIANTRIGEINIYWGHLFDTADLVEEMAVA